jgi:hypothetical protein
MCTIGTFHVYSTHCMLIPRSSSQLMHTILTIDSIGSLSLFLSGGLLLWRSIDRYTPTIITGETHLNLFFNLARVGTPLTSSVVT